MTRIHMGESWLMRFDSLTAKGIPAREIVAAMATEMDRLGDLAVDAEMRRPAPPMLLVTYCPHCGKQIP